MTDDIARAPVPETEATRHGDKIRHGEAGSPSYLYKIAVNKDDYNHAMIHAGYVIPKDASSFLACPLCGASFGGGK